jgi:uncharacterized membrane protein HdeD (DUF308 family)
LTPDDIRAGDDAAEYASKHWASYLASGILTVLFGFVVLSFKVETIWTLEMRNARRVWEATKARVAR